MNLSLQLARGLGTLALCSAVSANAITAGVSPAAADTATTNKEAAVVHSRLTIEAVRGDDNRTHYQVVGVRVGNPVEVSKNGARVSRVETTARMPLLLVADIRAVK